MRQYPWYSRTMMTFKLAIAFLFCFAELKRGMWGVGTSFPGDAMRWLYRTNQKEIVRVKGSIT